MIVCISFMVAAWSWGCFFTKAWPAGDTEHGVEVFDFFLGENARISADHDSLKIVPRERRLDLLHGCRHDLASRRFLLVGKLLLINHGALHLPHAVHDGPHLLLNLEGFHQDLDGSSRFRIRSLRIVGSFPPVVALESVSLRSEGEEEEEAGGGFNILAYVLPGFSIMGILFLAQSATRDILRDRESGLLRHLLTAPVSVNDYLGGKCLSVFAVTALGFALFVLIGIAAGIHWGPVTAVVPLMLASALAAAGLLILIMSLVGSERQGDTLTTIIIIVSSMLGGAFMPVSQMPSFLKPISAATLVYWSTEGFPSSSFMEVASPTSCPISRFSRSWV